MLNIEFKYKHPQLEAFRSSLSAKLSKSTEPLLADWTRFNRNLSLHLPGRELDWYFWQYEQACINQQLVISELSCRLLQQQLADNPVPRGYFMDAGIIVTFHYGSYRILGKWLALSSIKFVLVVSGSVKSQQEDLFRAEISSCTNAPNCFDVLDANDPRIIFKIRSAVACGFMVLIYVDGNVGRKNHHHARISLFDMPINVHIGAAKIASLLKLPIYEVIGFRDAESIGFSFYPLLYAPARSSRGNVESCSLTEQIFKHLRDHLHTAPHLWENWFYLDEFR